MKEPPSIDVSVIGGHPVQVSILLPGQHGEKAARQFLTLRWRSSSDGSISLPFSAASLLEDEMASAALWIPDAFDGIELESRNGCLLPLLACASRISPDASAVLRPAFTEGTSFLHVTVQGDNGTLLSDAWEINVLSLSADCTRWLVALETDSSGSLTVPVRAGTYEVRCSPSFIEPFAKVVVTVGAGERSEVVVPIVR